MLFVQTVINGWNKTIKQTVVNDDNIENKKLIASDGMTLTNGEAFGKEIFLGINDSADNWHEISDKEAERLQAESLPEASEVEL